MKYNVYNSFFIDGENKKFIPLREAPEWIMNNLYLLNIEDIKVKPRSPDESPTEYKNIKPIELLKKLSSFSDKYLNGFYFILGERMLVEPHYASIASIKNAWNF